MEGDQASFSTSLKQQGFSTSTYPYGPNWSSVKPFHPAAGAIPKQTLPGDLGTTRRQQHPRPPSAFDTRSLRYPNTYTPDPSEKYKGKLNLQVKLLGGGMDGTTVPVQVKTSGTVAEVITTAVERLRMNTGTQVPYDKLRVTGLYSESGRPLSAGYRLHSQGQVPQVKDGSTLVLKVLH